MAECQASILKVVGSSPITRSNNLFFEIRGCKVLTGEQVAIVACRCWTNGTSKNRPNIADEAILLAA